MRGFLALEDGRVFEGESVGAAVDGLGEAVFNTGMTGYQEVVSDPSYAGQLVVLSAAEVGNYGCNAADMESRGLFLSGLVTQQLNEPSSWRSEESLGACLRRFGRPALSGVDTRALVLHLRERGTLKGYLHGDGSGLGKREAVRRAREWAGLDGVDTASGVSGKEIAEWREPGVEVPPPRFRVVAYDFGIKRGILRRMAAAGMAVTVVPAWTEAKVVLGMRPDGVLLSNGPGDPAGVRGAVGNARALIGKVPVMGICLGHQILGLACGGTCRRLKFGHHGGNHPVRNLLDGRVEITSQNHNFCVDGASLPKGVAVSHVNLYDGSVEGIAWEREPVLGVQFHPEASPGPWDARYLFGAFAALMEGRKGTEAAGMGREEGAGR